MTETFVDAELHSQPQTWRHAAALLPDVTNRLPRAGARVAVVGCGTSWFMAQSYAALREARGQGETDAFSGSEFPEHRAYDLVMTISRSGTTTEIVQLLRATHTPTLLITAVGDAPAVDAATDSIVMGFADEQSVVQTRFATTTLALLRAHLGDDIEHAAADAHRALRVDVAPLLDAEQTTFLGRGWTIGLAAEAALKTREAAQYWSESYPAMDYRHGPLAIAQPDRQVWAFGAVPDGLRSDVASTGARFVHHDLDPMAALVVAQRFAVGLARARGLDPDHPRSLTRSVILAG